MSGPRRARRLAGIRAAVPLILAFVVVASFAAGAGAPPARAAAPAQPGVTSSVPESADPSPPTASELAVKELNRQDAAELRRVMERIDRELSPYAPVPDWRDLGDYVSGRGLRFDVPALLSGLVRYFGHEVVASLRVLGQVIVLAVLAALLAQLRLAESRPAVGRVAEAVVLLVLAGVALEAFYVSMRVASGAVGELRDILLASLPLLLTLLAGTGAAATAGLLHPLVLSFADLTAFLAADVAFPAVFFAAVLELTSLFSQPFGVTGLSRLLRQSALALLALALTGFVGLVTVLGAAGTVADGVGLRTAKFAAATFVPVIGKTLADAADLVASASLLVRSGVGATALLLVFLAVAFPLLKLVSMVFAFRLGGALVQPLGVAAAGSALAAMGDSIAMVSLVVGAVALMCFLSIAAMLAAGAGVTMLR